MKSQQCGQGQESTWWMRRGWPGLAQPGESSEGTWLLSRATEMGDCTEDRARLFWKVHSRRVRDNRHMLQQKEFWWNIRRKMCMMNIMKHWNRLSRDVKDCPSLEIFMTKLHRALCDLMWLWIWTHLSSSWARWSAKVPYKTNNFVIIYKWYSQI